MQIQISWLLQKPTDLDLHCLLRQGMLCSAKEGLKWLPGAICIQIVRKQTIFLLTFPQHKFSTAFHSRRTQIYEIYKAYFFYFNDCIHLQEGLSFSFLPNAMSYIKTGYIMNVLWQIACMVVNEFTVVENLIA